MFDGLNNVPKDGLLVLFGIDSDELVGELGVDELLESSVLKELLFDLGMLVVVLVHQASEDLVVCDMLVEHIIEFVCNWVKTSLLQLLVNEVVRHFKGNEQVWLKFKFLEHRDLIVA